MISRLAGRRALVTGASSGVGRALALTLGACGVQLALSSRSEGPLSEVADQIARGGGPRPAVLVADLSRRGEASGLAARAEAAVGPIDLLVNNAGAGLTASLWVGGDGDAAREMMETNLWSPLALIGALVPGMRARGAGTVVNVSSIGGLVATPFIGHYAASKGALSQASEALRMELRGSGVQVLHVVLGPINTPMLAEALVHASTRQASRWSPLGDPEALADLIARGVARGRTGTLVYPRALTPVSLFPRAARWFARRTVGQQDMSDPALLRGGSQGDPASREARARFLSRS